MRDFIGNNKKKGWLVDIPLRNHFFAVRLAVAVHLPLENKKGKYYACGHKQSNGNQSQARNRIKRICFPKNIRCLSDDSAEVNGVVKRQESAKRFKGAHILKMHPTTA